MRDLVVLAVAGGLAVLVMWPLFRDPRYGNKKHYGGED